MISVIVPIYNSERYLRKCLKSILTQTYCDLELILVNDCSKDSSYEICDEYCKKDNRVVIINKIQNEGVDKARFSGIEIAKGEYLFFVDSDDWLPSNALQMLHSYTNLYDCDVLLGVSHKSICGYTNPFSSFSHCKDQGQIVSHEEFMSKYYLGFFGFNNFRVNIWGVLYKKSLLERSGVSACGASFGEDLVFNMKVLPFANSLFVSNCHVYNYRIALGSKWKYGSRWLENARFIYNIKCEYQKKYHVLKGDFYIHVELINLLKTFVAKSLFVRNVSKQQKIRDLEIEMSHSEYSGVEILKNTWYPDQHVVDMVLSKDAISFYDYVEKLSNDISLKERIIRFVKSKM